MLRRSKHLIIKVFLQCLVAALMAVPALYAQQTCPDGSQPLTSLNVHFSGDSYRPGSNCGAASCTDRLVMGGSGQIHGHFCVGQKVTVGEIQAEGSFAHYDITFPAGNNIPFKFTGTWKATNFRSFELTGLYGTDSQGNTPLAAGVLVADIVLVRPPTTAIPLTRVPSLLTLVSNLQPAGVPNSGQPDGVTLIAPNPGGFLFVPIPVQSVLPLGLGTMEAHTPVLFSTLNEDRGEPPQKSKP
jgi:hypothetical protein